MRNVLAVPPNVFTEAQGLGCAEAKADAVLITALDETAWLFNMRGGDVSYNPIFVSYGLVTPKETTLFVDAAKACSSPGSSCQCLRQATHVMTALVTFTLLSSPA